MASTCRPPTWPQVRARAADLIASSVTLGLCRNRVIRISPARLPPSRLTLTLPPPYPTRRPYKKAPLLPGVRPQNLPGSPPSDPLTRESRPYRVSFPALLQAFPDVLVS